jgi:hypothetical protein
MAWLEYPYSLPDRAFACVEPHLPPRARVRPHRPPVRVLLAAIFYSCARAVSSTSPLLLRGRAGRRWHCCPEGSSPTLVDAHHRDHLIERRILPGCHTNLAQVGADDLGGLRVSFLREERHCQPVGLLA